MINLTEFQNLVDPFHANIDFYINTKADDYSAILKTIEDFLEQPFAATVENKTFTERWSAANTEWT